MHMCTYFVSNAYVYVCVPTLILYSIMHSVKRLTSNLTFNS